MTDLGSDVREGLINGAREARAAAYAPYSDFSVGAAVLDAEGRVFSGSNVENASYGLTICAERSAVFAAIAEGVRELKVIALVSETGAPPCGACRQVLSEFASEDFDILAADAEGTWQRHTAAERWPMMFGKHSLPSFGQA